MKIALYVRKSKATDQGESIDTQIALCKQYASLHFSDAVITTYVDEGFSGGNVNRPSFQKLLGDLKHHAYAILMCYRLDRISRNVLDFSSILSVLTTHHVAFVSIRENFDTTTSMGRAMLQIASVFAELERATLTERIRDNMLELSKTGRWLGGTSPIGYLAKRSSYEKNNKIKHYTHLVVDEVFAPTVQLIFNKYLGLGSISKLETYLLQHQIKTSNGQRFRPNSLRTILSNPVYVQADKNIYTYFEALEASFSNTVSEFNGVYGLMTYNKYLHGKASSPNPVSEWTIAIGEHAPLIASNTWIDVQKRLLENKDKAIPNKKSSIALLGGLLRCQNCGSPMAVMGQDVLQDGTLSYSYRCSLKVSSKGTLCHMENAKGHYLDKQIYTSLHTKLMNTDLFKTYFKKRLASPNVKYHTSNRCANLLPEKKKYEKAIQKFLDLMVVEDSLELIDLYKKEIQKNTKKLKDLDSALKQYEQTPTNDCSAPNTEYNLERFKDTYTFFESLSVAKKICILKSCIDHIDWDGTTATIYLYANAHKAD